MKDRAKLSKAGTMTEPSRTYNYNGYEMRSIAECRWAAFFDICEIKWQVEPLSTGDYIPDFLLFGENPTLVEVKGGATTLEALKQQTEYVPERLVDHWQGNILCVGASPVLDDFCGLPVFGFLFEDCYHPDRQTDQTDRTWWRELAIGSYCDGNFHENNAPAHRQRRFGFRPDGGAFNLRPWGCYEGGSCPAWPLEDIEAKWAEATNRVRYLHGGAKG